MSIPESIIDLSENPADNSPQGGEYIGGTLDDFLRAHAAIMKRDLLPKSHFKAENLPFEKGTSGLVATNVQAGLQEISKTIKAQKSDINGLTEKGKALESSINGKRDKADRAFQTSVKIYSPSAIVDFRKEENGARKGFIGIRDTTSDDIYIGKDSQSGAGATLLVLRENAISASSPLTASTHVDIHGATSVVQFKLSRDGSAHGYIGNPSEDNKDLVWHSYQHNTTISLTGRGVEANKPIYIEGKQVITQNMGTQVVLNKNTTLRHASGLYGVLHTQKIDSIWSTDVTFKIDTNGADFGNLNGLAYRPANNTTGGTMAGGHQIVVVGNGEPKVSLGMNGNIWCSGTITGNGGGLTNLNWNNIAGKPNVHAKGEIAVLAGVVGHGGTIPLPSGFTQSQCRWIVSINKEDVDGNAISGQVAECSTAGRVVTALVRHSFGSYVKKASANYLIIGVK